MTATLEERLAQAVWTMGAIRIVSDPRVQNKALRQPDLEDGLSHAMKSCHRAEELLEDRDEQ